MLRLLFLFSCLITSSAKAEDTIPVTISGRLQSEWNNETSGLVASAVNKGLLYIINDSGDSSRFFVISTDGKLKAVYYFNGQPGIRWGVTDCEDIAAGPGPVAGKHYIYLADIGDNRSSKAERAYITIYRAEEPVLTDTSGVYTGNITTVPLYLKYPDGPRDAETIMVDPVQKLLYIISKREDSVGVYTTPLNYRSGDTVILSKRTSLFFKGIGFTKQITGGDISRDGSQIIIKSYAQVYYWKRKGKEPVWRRMMAKPAELPYKIEVQGEAIGFNYNGTGYYTISEELNQPIYYYRMK